jgi:hypothetical protein
MAYDVRPLETLKEKERLLNEFASTDTVLFFEHDPGVECATIKQTERGVALEQTHSLKEFFS